VLAFAEEKEKKEQRADRRVQIEQRAVTRAQKRQILVVDRKESKEQ
jgi:hypothetical protein